MTNKISKEFLFTELSIKIATLEMKIDRLLELAIKNDHLLNTEYVIDFEDGTFKFGNIVSDEEFGESFK